MKFGLNNENYELLQELLIKPLKKYNAKIYIFGSRARGQHHPYSDLDVLFEENQDNPIPSVDLSNIKENLENSNLPIKVDLVADQYLAKSYKESVYRDRMEI